MNFGSDSEEYPQATSSDEISKYATERPSILQRLKVRQKELSAELRQVDKSIAALEKNPEIADVIITLSKTRV